MQIGQGVFLVTGGASGLGAAAARLLAELGGGARFVATNVADEASAGTAVDLAVAESGGLQGLVNCADIIHAETNDGKDGAHALEAFRRVIDVNLVGTFNMIRLAALAMAKNESNAAGERGVNVGGGVRRPDGAGGLRSVEGGHCRHELPIAPGIFEMPMMGGMPAEVQEALGKMVSFPSRLGRPEEFAPLVRQIVENPYLNGEVIRIDGAIRMRPK